MRKEEKIVSKYMTEDMMDLVWDLCPKGSKTLSMDYAEALANYILRSYSVDFIRGRAWKETGEIIRDMDKDRIDVKELQTIIFHKAKEYKPDVFTIAKILGAVPKK